MSTKNVTKAKRKNIKTVNKKKTNHALIVCSTVMGVIVFSAAGIYFGGRSYYSGKFLANTTINDRDVSGMSYEKACDVLGADNENQVLNVKTIDGKSIGFDLSEIGYKVNSKNEIKKALDTVNYNTWFSGLSHKSSFSFTEKTEYDKDKLEKLLREADWSGKETKNAEIIIKDGKCELTKEVQGGKIEDMDKFVSYVTEMFDGGVFNVSVGADAGCYKLPEETSETLKEKYEKIKKVLNMSITYDFDYTTEKLSGKNLTDMIAFDDDGNYTVDSGKAMEYVEKLAKKYDTYNTKRKFKATKQGNIVIPTSSDAKYGWWIDQQKTCDALVAMLEEGKTIEKVDPVYYQDGAYIFTGVESARSKENDIGKTYVEVDLSAQHLWVYKDGKLKYETDIVSGQTTSEARTTLPGVYKVWYKAENYRMKDENADGEKWDTTCNYWTSVSPVGIGLHDSTWRWYFGGTIYQYNGSHGCINMPLEGAKYVYENVAMGTPVVMYY